MTSLLILIPAALTLGLVGLAAFLWALCAGQFDDLEGAANRVLFDDDAMPGPSDGPSGKPAARPALETVPPAKKGDNPCPT